MLSKLNWKLLEIYLESKYLEPFVSSFEVFESFPVYVFNKVLKITNIRIRHKMTNFDIFDTLIKRTS